MRGLDAGWQQFAARLEETGPTAKESIEVQDNGRVKLKQSGMRRHPPSEGVRSQRRCAMTCSRTPRTARIRSSLAKACMP